MGLEQTGCRACRHSKTDICGNDVSDGPCEPVSPLAHATLGALQPTRPRESAMRPLASAGRAPATWRDARLRLSLSRMPFPKCTARTPGERAFQAAPRQNISRHQPSIVKQCAPAQRFRWERSAGASAPSDGAQFAPLRRSLGSAAENTVKTQSPYSPPTVPLQSPLQSPMEKIIVPVHSVDSEDVWRLPSSLRRLRGTVTVVFP